MRLNGLSLGTSWIEQSVCQLCVVQVGSQTENGDCCFQIVCFELADQHRTNMYNGEPTEVILMI